MSKTLNLFAQLLAAGQTLRAVGRPDEARRRLSSLLALADVPAEVATDAHRLMGEIHHEQENYAHARKHLKLALRETPDDAEIRFLLAEAMAADEAACWASARKHYRVAIAAQPTNARYLCGYANLAVLLGNEALALRLFRRAVKVAPADLDALEGLTDMLCGMLQFAEAEAALRKARFQLSRNARLEQMLADVQFDRVHARQSSAGVLPDADEATFLPFDTTTPRTSAIVRRDRVSRPTPHLPRLMAFRPDSRQMP